MYTFLDTLYICQVCIKKFSNIKHLKSEEYFFKIQKTIVKTGTPTIPIKICWRKIKFIWALISQMCKSYEVVNPWILALTLLSFNTDWSELWVTQWIAAIFSVSARFHAECIYLYEYWKQQHYLFIKVTSFVLFPFLKKALYLENSYNSK